MIDDDIIRLLHKEEYVGKGLSLQKVADKISVSKQALYGRFKSLGLPVRTLGFGNGVDELPDDEGEAA